MGLWMRATTGDPGALHDWRERLALRYQHEADHAERWCVDGLADTDRRRAAAFLGEQLHGADIVYWESELFIEATEGQMAWQDAPLPGDIFPAGPQLWFLPKPAYIQFSEPHPVKCKEPILGAVALVPTRDSLLVAALIWDAAQIPSPPYTVPSMWEEGKPLKGGLLFLPAAAAFLTLPFVGLEWERPSRQVRRQYERKQQHIPEFQRVLLRKRQAKERGDNGEERCFSCHFRVRGHWRKRSERWGEGGPIYVREHIKGDMEQPFRSPRERIYQVVR